ncbi:hypothetical protein, conserved [Eimeria necatrix]|uniref:Uncharacterized protein n=1 Tax=Eimeria necatrix TaxID=51315 RepID=U6MML2_9EIME|nr:hypothetical protein, conserved [Eimeria necatrix]CDJ65256.1 hypothetical protein, conserved [Eimeria necatrix]
MTLPLRLTPFGLEQKGVYIQQDRHDEYYEQLLYPCHKNSITGDCCCVSALLLGDQNAGKSALLYAFVAAQDPKYTALTCLLPIIQAEFANRRELFSMHDAAAIALEIIPADGQVRTTPEGDVHQGYAVCRCGDEQDEKQHYSSLSSASASRGTERATAEATTAELQETDPTGAVEALLCQSRDELPFLDSDVARSAALLTAEDFAFFCNEFGIHQEQPRGLRLKVNKSRYVLLHFLEFGGDHLDRMNAFLQFRSSCSCGNNCNNDPSKCLNKCAFSSNCRECDQAAATALLLQEQDCKTKETAAKAPSAPVTSLKAAGVNGMASARGAGQSRARSAAVTAAQASLLAQSLRASFLLAAEAPVVLYFINCSTMFIARSASGTPATTVSVKLNPSAFLTLLLRLHACCFVGSGKRLLHFVCSRLACRSVADVSAGGEIRASAVEGCSESSTGCCCSGFDQEENFRMALESLKTFVSRLCSDNAANAAAAAAVVSASAAETVEAVRRTLDQPFESLYCRFLADAGSSNNSSNCEGQGRVARNCISWVPFEDCWGVSACARIKDEEEALQRCGSVRFLQRLLNFVWDVCMTLPFCTTFDFRDVSAVRIIERRSHQYGEREQQQCAAWGPSWQLCVASVVQLLARLLALLSEAEDHAKEETNRKDETDKEGGKFATADALHSRPDRATTSESETSKYGSGELAAPSWKMQQSRQQQSQQRHEVLEGESGRQLISLFSTCVQQRRQQQQRMYLPGKVCIDLWISYTDWQDFISNFDPVEQQQLQQEQQQRHPKQQQQFTVSSTGEVMTTGTLEKDSLLLLPAAAAVAAFSSLAAAFASLGCCLPCCADGGPWGPLAVQLTVCFEATEAPVALLVLPEVLHEHFVAIQQQTQLRKQQEVRLHQKELLETSGGACLAAVRLPFHPAVARLVDNVLSYCVREPLPADFWEAGAGAAGAAAAVAGAAATAATAAQVGHTVLTLARQRVGEALHAAAESVQVLLHQLQQVTHRGKNDEASFEDPLVNSLQVLLHLAGDAVLIEQITKATEPTRSYGQQSQLQQGSNGQGTSQFHAEGPFFSQQQIFWIVNLQAPAAASSAAKAGNSTPGGETTIERDRYDAQAVDKRALLDPTLKRLNGMLAASGLVVLSCRNKQSCSSDVPNLKP